MYEGGRLVEQPPPQYYVGVDFSRTRDLCAITSVVMTPYNSPRYDALLRESPAKAATDRWAYGDGGGEWHGAHETREAAEQAAVSSFIAEMIRAGLTPDAPATRMVWTVARQPAPLYMDAEDVLDALRGCASAEYAVEVEDDYPVVAEHWRDDLARRVNDAIEEWRVAAGVEWPQVDADEARVNEVAITPELVTQVRLELAAAAAARRSGDGSRA